MNEATTTFNNLKHALTTLLVFAYPDFTLLFMVEIDACDNGISIVLLQEEHPISYFSKKLSALRQQVSTYSNELWALIEFVQKWCHYLLGNHFTTTY